MPLNFNRAVLCGYVAADPEVRTLTRGAKKVVRFTVMTNSDWTDAATGERRGASERHRIVIYNDRLAELAAKLVHKGTLVLVEGELKTRRYFDRERIERQITEIVLGAYKATLQIAAPAPVTTEDAAPAIDEAPPGGQPAW